MRGDKFKTLRYLKSQTATVPEKQRWRYEYFVDQSASVVPSTEYKPLEEHEANGSSYYVASHLPHVDLIF